MKLIACSEAYPNWLLGALLAGVLVVPGCSQPLGLGSGSTYDPSAQLANTSNRGTVPGGSHLHRSADENPNVVSGLRIVPAGKWNLRVETGACTVAGKPVTVGEPVLLTETPAAAVQVHAERVVLGDDPPHGYDHGTQLKGLLSDVTPLPGALDSGSVHVWSASADPRKEFHRDVDFLLDPEWGTISRKPGGAIPANGIVFVDYSVRQLRLDTVEVKSTGTVELKKGEPARSAPVPAEVDKDSLAIGTIFLDYSSHEVTPESVFAIGASYPEPTAEERQAMAATVAHTRAKLQANGKVTVVFWGDSVTEGGTTSAPAKQFPNLVGQALQAEFKGSQVSVVNAGVGGSNIDQRLATLDKDVLSHHPDLVVVEFVNDMSLAPGVVKHDYTSAVQRMKKAGTEVILTTPHFTMPEWMGMKSLHGKDPRHNVVVIREVARTEKVGLADVSRRWEHLAIEGIPYTALLYNGINHPDDRGHAIYAKAVTAFF